MPTSYPGRVFKRGN